MLRGHPSSPHSIVNINEVLTASQIIQENYSISLFAQSMPNTWEAMQWCAHHRLIQNSYICDHCNVECRLIQCGDISDGKVWNCGTCCNKKSFVLEAGLREVTSVSIKSFY